MQNERGVATLIGTSASCWQVMVPNHRMSFLQYVFRFLYVRNWHTGRHELSLVRVFWFLGVLIVGLVSVVGIYFLQLPITVTNSL